jgi:hypothetical protein
MYWLRCLNFHQAIAIVLLVELDSFGLRTKIMANAITRKPRGFRARAVSNFP